MNLVNAARTIESSVVAVVQKFHLRQQPFPTILGSGFFVSEHGVICTCRHVVEACLELPRPDGYAGLPFWVAAWREIEIAGKKHWGWLPMNVTEYGGVEFTGERPGYVEDATPDVAFLLCEFRGTPSVNFATAHVEIGEPVGFAGYPMGLSPLLGHQGFQQGSATTHAGIVAAIHPNRLAATPYGFLVHANTQGGASGSPVFREDGSVVGMLYMGIPDYYAISENGSGQLYYKVPTALSGCISGIRIAEAVAQAHEAAADRTDRPLLSDKLKTAKTHAEVAVMEPYKTTE